MPNILSIADDILIEGFDEWGKDHDGTLEKVLQVCRQEIQKLDKDKHLFICMSIPFFGVIISWQGVNPDPSNINVLTDMPLPKAKKELYSFLDT